MTCCVLQVARQPFQHAVAASGHRLVLVGLASFLFGLTVPLQKLQSLCVDLVLLQWRCGSEQTISCRAEHLLNKVRASLPHSLQRPKPWIGYNRETARTGKNAGAFGTITTPHQSGWAILAKAISNKTAKKQESPSKSARIDFDKFLLEGELSTLRQLGSPASETGGLQAWVFGIEHTSNGAMRQESMGSRWKRINFALSRAYMAMTVELPFLRVPRTTTCFCKNFLHAGGDLEQMSWKAGCSTSLKATYRYDHCRQRLYSAFLHPYFFCGAQAAYRTLLHVARVFCATIRTPYCKGLWKA